MPLAFAGTSLSKVTSLDGIRRVSPRQLTCLISRLSKATSRHGMWVEFKICRVCSKKNQACNGDLGQWNVAKLTIMETMFFGASNFSGIGLSNWQVGLVENVAGMFTQASIFNGNLSAWNVSRVTSLRSTFLSCTSFNSDLSSWDVRRVEELQYAFAGTTSFNSDISQWDVATVTDMSAMAANALSFNQNLCSWGSKVQENVDVSLIFTGSGCNNTADPVLRIGEVGGSSMSGPWCQDCDS